MSASVILCTAGYDHTIRFWQATSAQCHRSIQHNDSQVNHLEITPDKQWLAAAGNPNIRLYDINAPSHNHSPLRSLEGHSGNVTSVGFQKDCKWMFSSSEDGSVKIWDIRTPACQLQYANGAPINYAALHPNQVEIVSVDEDGVVRFWDLLTNKKTQEIVPEGKVPLRSVSIASDASFIAAGNNRGTCFIWKYGVEQDLSLQHRIDAHKLYLLKCLLSPDVKFLATTSADRTVRVWDLSGETVSLAKTLCGHQRWVWDCTFSADSAYLVTASSDKKAKLWDVKTSSTQDYDAVLEYRGHVKALTCVALHDSTSAM